MGWLFFKENKATFIAGIFCKKKIAYYSLTSRSTIKVYIVSLLKRKD